MHTVLEHNVLNKFHPEHFKFRLSGNSNLILKLSGDSDCSGKYNYCKCLATLEPFFHVDKYSSFHTPAIGQFVNIVKMCCLIGLNFI